MHHLALPCPAIHSHFHRLSPILAHIIMSPLLDRAVSTTDVTADVSQHRSSSFRCIHVVNIVHERVLAESGKGKEPFQAIRPVESKQRRVRRALSLLSVRCLAKKWNKNDIKCPEHGG